MSAAVVVAVMLGSFVFVIASYSGPAASYTASGPIVIDDNADFDTDPCVVGGAGTVGDPYIISGWEIDEDAGIGISVTGTDVYFVISSVYIHSTNGWLTSGIYFDGVSNAVIGTADIRTATCGVEVFDSNSLTIQSSSFTDVYTGIQLDTVDHVVVFDNTMNDGPQDLGVVGVYLDTASYCVIDNNTISLMSNAGINSWDSDHMVYSGNNASECGTYGILLQSDEDCTVFNNSISENGNTGLYLDDCTRVLVYHNSFYSNGVNQAYDFTGTDITWNAADPVGGNYWSDYAGTDGDLDGFGDTPYTVYGDPANGQDSLPLMAPPGDQTEIPEFGTVIVPVLVVLAAFMVARRRRSV